MAYDDDKYGKAEKVDRYDMAGRSRAASADPTGKSKFTVLQGRRVALSVAFVVGLCIGVVIAERAYIATNAAPGGGDGAAAGDGKIRLARGILAGTPGAASGGGGANTGAAGDLEALLRKVAPNKEVLVGVSNKNPLFEGMLDTWLHGITRAGVTNYVVVALDKVTEEALMKRGINVFYMSIQISKSQKDTGENHAVSALKFGILKKFLQLGWAVLLTDIDICILQNPFKHLYRDSDVEGMTDGFDEQNSYGAIEGYEDASMGWARFAQFYKHFNLNSGLFFLRANERTISLMARLEHRLARQKYWDQTAYNEEIFFLSHDNYKSPQVTVRVMGIYKFMNSKVLFKDVRKRPASTRPPMPVTVHINYHPDKHPRMKAVFRYYLEHDEKALDPFPGGSEPGSR